MFASQVENGERLAIPTCVWAARWKTARTSCSFSARDERLAVHRSACTTSQRASIPSRLKRDSGWSSRRSATTSRALAEQPLGKRAANEALRPGHQDRGARPAVRHASTSGRQGAWPRSHSSFSSRLSL